MFYFNSKRFNDDTTCAAYGLLNAEGRQQSLLQAIIALLAKDATVQVTRFEGGDPIDVTEELAECGWAVYDCPALEEIHGRYDVFFTLKNTDDSFVMSILTREEGVTIEVTGSCEDEFDDPHLLPFLPMVDAVENFAHYLEGYRAGVSSCSDETGFGAFAANTRKEGALWA